MTTNPRTSDMEALTQVLQLAANTRFTAAEQNLVREGMTRWAEQLGTAAGQAMRGIGAAVAQHYAPAIRLLSKLAADQAVLVDEDQADDDQDDEQPAGPWIGDDDLAAAYAESGAEAVSDAEDGPRPDTHIAGLRGVLNLERARHAREIREAREQAAPYWRSEAVTAYRERDEVRRDLVDSKEAHLAALRAHDTAIRAECERSDKALILAEAAINSLARAVRYAMPDASMASWRYEIDRLTDRLADLRASSGDAQPRREPKMGDRVHVTPDPFDGRLVWVGAYGNTVLDDDGTEHTHAMRELTALEPAAGAEEARDA